MSDDTDKAVLCYLDTETTVRCPITNNKAHPCWPSNKVVMAGALPYYLDGSVKNREATILLYDLEYAVPVASLPALSYPFSHLKATSNVTYVGHNVGFDIAHCIKPDSVIKQENYNFSVRDTAVAEYLLSKQVHVFPALDDLSSKYLGTTKDPVLKNLWDSGTQTEDIPITVLKPYLEGDVKNTKGVFEEQVVLLQQEGLMPLFRVQSEAQMALIDMYRNGMHVNLTTLDELRDKSDIAAVKTLEELDALAKGCTDGGLITQKILWSSNKDISRLFFGGKVTKTEKQLVGRYKNGKDKYKNVEVEVYDKGFELAPAGHGAAANTMGYAVSDDVLKSIVTNVSPPASSVAKLLLEYRKIQKEVSTYLVPIKNNTFPDGCIHANINNTATITGRYSSTNPNIQNITDYSQVKSIFDSRYGSDGVIVTADFNQIEVVGLAYLSQDQQLIDDINDGVDIHTALYHDAFGHRPDAKQRKAFKPITFGLIYGAGVTTLVANTGLSITSVKAFIDAFHYRYPDVKRWWAANYDLVVANRAYQGKFDAEKRPIGESFLLHPTGRKLYFKEYWQENFKTRKLEASFSPTEVKNYPVQSFSTGDVVPLVLGKVFRQFWANELLRSNAVIVNTQHDSYIFDCRREHVDRLNLFIAEHMTKVKQYLKEEFDLDNFNLDTTVGVTWDTTWKETENAHIWKHTRKHDSNAVLSEKIKGAA